MGTGKDSASAEASSSDVAGLRNRVAQLEGENTRLKGQLSHAEVHGRGWAKDRITGRAGKM